MNPSKKSIRYILHAFLAWSLAGLLAPVTFAANTIWLSTPTDGNWSTAANWDTGITPVAGDTLVFTNSAITSTTNDVIVAANINAITFAAGGDAFSIWGNGFILNGNVTNASANAQVINTDVTLNGDRTLIGGAGLTLAGQGTLLNSGGNRTLNNWLTNGSSLTINNITLSEAPATARTLTLQGEKGNTTITGIIANGSTASGTMTYAGGGAVTMNGAAASTYGGTLNVNNGSWLLDFVNLTPAVNLLGGTNPIALGGGTFGIIGKSTGATFQTNGVLTLQGNTGNGLTLTNNGGAGTTLRVASVTRNGGSSLQINTSAGDSVIAG
ncbi:MAG: hypothetical protein H7Y43_00385, partial [Akkermansiaceae bacterium]|nr:hypothetical protein [Verrucomicrobiales bacterium]